MLQIDYIIHLVAVYKYFLLFPVAVFEGPIISVIGGFLSSKMILIGWVAYLVLVFGDITGDIFYYSVGRYGGRRLAERWGVFLRITPARLAYAEEHFKKEGGRTLLLGKTNAWGAVILVAAGISKMNFLKFVLYNSLGTIIKTLLLFLIGYYFGQAYDLINHYLGLTAAITTTLFTMIIILYFYIRFRKKNEWKA
jgi:membrane protein DedA with SNARE-associated domain